MDEQDPIRVPGTVMPPDAESTGDKVQASGPNRSLRIALVIAVAADLVQLLLLPLLAEGALAPLDDLLDIAVAIALVKLLGWHWVLLPSCVAKLVPGVDEFPCWTIAVLLVRADRARLRYPRSSP
jgi:hypothetical protein